jgi:hypothetical protein
LRLSLGRAWTTPSALQHRIVGGGQSWPEREALTADNWRHFKASKAAVFDANVKGLGTAAGITPYGERNDLPSGERFEGFVDKAPIHQNLNATAASDDSLTFLVIEPFDGTEVTREIFWHSHILSDAESRGAKYATFIRREHYRRNDYLP